MKLYPIFCFEMQNAKNFVCEILGLVILLRLNSLMIRPETSFKCYHTIKKSRDNNFFLGLYNFQLKSDALPERSEKHIK